MPFRAWLLIAALGCLIPLSGQTQEQAEPTQGGAQTEQQPAPPLPIPFPVDVVEDEATAQARERSEAESDQREKDDLVAQQGMNLATQAMNEATQRMAFYSVLSTWLVGIGTALLIVTLWLTRQANRAAQDAVSVTREVGRDQMRAYLHVEKAEFFWGGHTAESPNITLTIQNTGQTPAKWFEVVSCAFVRELNENGRDSVGYDFQSVNFNGKRPARWNAIGGNGELTVPCWHQKEMKAISAVYRRKDISINVAGVVRYQTFFKEVFETEFWFTRRSPRPHRFDPATARKDGLASYGTPELPQSLARASCELRTYAKISE